MLTAETATRIVRAGVDSSLTVRRVRPLSGGMVNTVLEFLTDGDPPAVVAKLTRSARRSFRAEHESLKYYAAHTDFPVPRPLAYVEGCEGFDGKCLLLEKVPGRHLGRASLSAEGAGRFQKSLAAHLAGLHGHTRDRYGPAYETQGAERWIEVFGPEMSRHFEAAKDRLDSRTVTRASRILEELDRHLPESGRPTLVHGDLWATNIMVDDTDPDRPGISAFLDGRAVFRDVEYELAYLFVFSTADARFLAEYGKVRDLRPGFEQRFRIYWLNTMLEHVAAFGSGYVPAARRLVTEINP